MRSFVALLLVGLQFLSLDTVLASDGTRHWSRMWGSADDDEPRAVAIDTGGFVYVAGKTRGMFDGQTNQNLGWFDIFLTKFSAGGVKQWSRIWGANATDEARAAAPDGAGNVYVAGNASGNFDGQTTHVGYTDFFVSRCAPDGPRFWSRIWGSADYDDGTGVAVDPAGNVYVAGYTQGTIPGQTNYGGPQDFVLTKFDAAGVQQWLRKFGSAGRDFAEGCAVDSAGNVYMTGFTEGFLHGYTNMGGQDIVLVKYDAGGAWQWTRVWGTNGTDRGIAVALDAAGYVYVAGYSDGALDGQPKPGGYDMFLSKFDPSGNKIWTRMAGSPQEERAYGVCVDSENNVYLSGETLGSFDGQTNSGPGYFDACLVKFTPDGQRVWTRLWGSSRSDGALACAARVSNAVYAALYARNGFDGQTNVLPFYEDAALSRFGYGSGGTLTVHSENPFSGVAIAVSRPDDAGNSNGVTPFARAYGAAWETTLTAPAMASGRIFDRWRITAAEITNNPLTLVMDTNYSVTAVYLSDAFAAAWPLSSASGSVTANNSFATYEPGEPGHYGLWPHKSIWWRFTPGANGRLMLNTYSSTFDTVIAAYTGDAVSNLQRVAADYTPGGMSALTISNAGAGITYHIVIDSYASWSYGRAVLNWSFQPNSAYDGAVVINEVMANPQAVADADGEWVELRNTTNVGVNVAGWFLKGGASGTMNLPLATLAVNDFLVLCRNNDPAQNGGVSGAWAAAGMNLLNAADSLWLYDASTQLVDVVAWDSAALGVSREVRDPWQDNFAVNGSNWAQATVSFGLGDYGTPGQENSTFIPEPTALGTLIILYRAIRKADKCAGGKEPVYLEAGTDC
ncbi:MAG: SBBP repeat-containing protein [bacterium]|nr:SBBP repeat-containing protein [bacterium]